MAKVGFRKAKKSGAPKVATNPGPPESNTYGVKEALGASPNWKVMEQHR